MRPRASIDSQCASGHIPGNNKRKGASDPEMFPGALPATPNGTELNAVLPKMSPLNPQYLTKKQSVFQKIAAFVEKFKGVGGQV